MVFINDLHKANFNLLSSPAVFAHLDCERLSLFYIISGNDDLFRKKHVIYDFSKNHLMFTSFKNAHADFCSSSKALIRLGLNLFNGYTDKYTNPLNILSCLGDQNYELAINAIKLRFNFF